jgi:hypothetical protein
MVTLRNIGDVLFKFVEDGSLSYCAVYITDDYVVIPDDIGQLNDLISTITNPSYIRGDRAGIPDAMLVEYTPSPNDTCSICLQKMDEDDEDAQPWISLSLCHHHFHRHCIRQWLQVTCPLCRTVHRA